VKPQVSRHSGESYHVTESRVTEPGLQAGSPPLRLLTCNGALIKCQVRRYAWRIGRHQGDPGKDPPYRPTHLLTVFDLLAKNDLDDGGCRRC
jgi:hypothetical protein